MMHDESTERYNVMYSNIFKEMGRFRDNKLEKRGDVSGAGRMIVG